MLNKVCKLAICADAFAGVQLSTSRINGVTRHNIVKIIVPITLKETWITVVLFAFLLVPTDANNAVIQVPMFIPNKTNAALCRFTTPLVANACKIPTDADED